MNQIKILATLFLGTCLMFSCKKDQYIKDTGLNENTTRLSTYDYLKSNNQFDTLVSIIDHFNLKDSVNKSATFFACTDYAVKKFMQTINVSSLDELYASITSKFLTQYMFAGKITTDDLTLNPVVYTNWAAASAPCVLYKTENLEYINLSSSAPAFTFYLVRYKTIIGVDDTDPGRPSDDKEDLIMNCQTTGINTATGTVLHVFTNNVDLNKL
jgi:hypothetical protein